MPPVLQADSKIVQQLITDKLSALSTLLRSNQFTSRDDTTRGDLLSSVQLDIQNYLAALKTSSTTVAVNQFKAGNINSSGLYNNFWASVGNDLTALYAEANNIGQTLVDHHNYVMADIQNILIQLKTLTSDIENYSLISSSPVGNIQSYSEKFTDTARLEMNSKLLGDTQCTLDTVGGIVTLGISQSNPVIQTGVNSVVIGAANSNGTTFGATQLSDVINNSSFQLFQYEHTSPSPDVYNLSMDFTINLKKPTILNFIRVVPNNFGTKTWPTITALDVSADGVNFTSIRDVLLSVNDDPAQFTLAPYSSSFAGEGRYTFLPEKVSFVHFTIQQTSPYYDVSRNLYRWAIGIKDIELVGNQYAATSQLISAPYSFPAGVEKIAIDGNELPELTYDSSFSPSSMGVILHDISIDSGMTWRQVTPTYVSTYVPTTAPQILNVNNIESQLAPTDPASINTIAPATTVRYRLRLASNNTAGIPADILPYFSPVVKQVSLKVYTQATV